jgi:hypothetical protein
MKQQKCKPLLKPLTQEEKVVLLPLLLRFFREKTSETNQVTAKDIIQRFNDKKDQIGFKCAFNNSRFMKLTNYIRAQKMLKLVSTHKGYYESFNPNDIEECGHSLMSRIESIKAAANGMFEMAAEMKHEASMIETCPLGFTWD